MSFLIQNFVRQTVGYNSGEVTLQSGAVVGGPAIFSYANLLDTVATIVAANYFSGAAFDLSVNDLIFVTGSDSSGLYQVSAVNTSVNPPTVSVVSYATIGTVGTANIQNNAVTYAKIQQTSAGSVLIGNPTGSAANVSEITLGPGLVFSGTSLQIDPLFENEVEISMTAAQWNGMFAAPVQVIAAPGANKMIVVEKVMENMTFVTTAYAGGGVVGLQYGNTANLAGPQASATEAAADFFAAASTVFLQGGGVGAGVATASAANTAVYISNKSGAFTTGDGTWKIRVWYRVVPTNA